jgi:hypothetical protein
MANDIITHLDDAATQGMTLNQALDKMCGPVDTKIRLRIAREGQDAPIELTIVRAGIRLAGADLQVAVKEGKLQIEARGAPVLDFEKGAPITVIPMSGNEFFVDGGDHTRLAFERDPAGKATRLVLNPGPWQITGQRINWLRIKRRREGPLPSVASFSSTIAGWVKTGRFERGRRITLKFIIGPAEGRRQWLIRPTGHRSPSLPPPRQRQAPHQQQQP